MGSSGHKRSDPDDVPLTCPAGYTGICEQEAYRNDDEVLHLVSLSHPFHMQVTELTQTQFRAVTGFNPSIKNAGEDDHPVNAVTWFDALAFANALSEREALKPCYELTEVLCGRESLARDSGEACFQLAQTIRWATVKLHEESSPYDCEGYRLPTEAEWEFAARGGPIGGTGREAAPFDGDIGHASALDEVAWYDVDRLPVEALDGAHPVAQKRANACGLYDMLGNVWEWVWDAYGQFREEDAQSARLDPAGPDEVQYPAQSVSRGCSWGSYGEYCRIADRNAGTPDGCFLDTSFEPPRVVNFGSKGFRLVRTDSPP